MRYSSRTVVPITHRYKNSEGEVRVGERAGNVSEGRSWHRWRRSAVVLFAAAALGAGLAVPAIAADEPPRETRVVGGTAVPDGKYPFMAYIRNNAPGVDNDFACTGTLIDESHVLTAAHCSRVPASQLRIAVGRTALSSSQGEVRGASAISRHPRYAPSRSEAYDVAVIRLSSPVPGIRPIQLDAPNSNAFERPGRLLRVAGWGTTRFGGRPVDRMREARPPVVSDANAREAYGTSFVPPLMVAAGKKGVDTCQGDSGGPIFAPVSGGYRQVGITSFGNGCAQAGFPGVYTEVSAPAVGNFIRQAQTR